MSKEYLKVGQIVGNRGISGELKVKSFCDSPEYFCEIENLYFSPGGSKIDVTQKKVFKNLVLIKIDMVKNVEDTVDLIGRYIYANKEDMYLETGRYFIDDIIGMDVIDDKTGQLYGKVFDVIQTGANDVYCIKNGIGKEYLIPVIDDVVKKIDTEDKKIYISPLRGLFDD